MQRHSIERAGCIRSAKKSNSGLRAEYRLPDRRNSLILASIFNVRRRVTASGGIVRTRKGGLGNKSERCPSCRSPSAVIPYFRVCPNIGTPSPTGPAPDSCAHNGLPACFYLSGDSRDRLPVPHGHRLFRRGRAGGPLHRHRGPLVQECAVAALRRLHDSRSGDRHRALRRLHPVEAETCKAFKKRKLIANFAMAQRQAPPSLLLKTNPGG